MGAWGCPAALGRPGWASTRWQHARTEARWAAWSGPGPSTTLGSLALLPAFCGCCHSDIIPHAVWEKLRKASPPSPGAPGPTNTSQAPGPSHAAYPQGGHPQGGQGETRGSRASGAWHRLGWGTLHMAQGLPSLAGLTSPSRGQIQA